MKENGSQAPGLMPVILATQEAQVRRIEGRRGGKGQREKEERKGGGREEGRKQVTLSLSGW
jgi:hypothetical protein